MQEELPKPQRAWLYLRKDAALVYYAKWIKAERDHVLEEIMPSVQRTLFGTAATSLKEYMPVHGVARMDALIGGEEAESAGEGAGVAAPIVPLHDKKNEFRDQHRALVGGVSRKTGIDHRRLNAELIKRTGAKVDQATVAQLLRRIALLEKWRNTDFDGERQ